MLIHTPLFCAPPIQSFLPLLGSDQWVLCNEPKLTSIGYRNKFQIVDKQGIKTFTIPLKASTRDLPYNQIEMSYQERWQAQMFNALQTAYGKSPFWEHYAPALQSIFLNHTSPFLWDFNLALLTAQLKMLKWPVQLHIEDQAVDIVEYVVSPLAYYQVFASEIGFTPGLSLMDLLFNEGIHALDVLWSMKNNSKTINYLR